MFAKRTWSTARLSVAAPAVAIAIASGGAGPANVPDASPWQSAGSMHVARASGMVAQLQTGKILVAGGLNGSTLLASAEVYTQAQSGTGTWTTTGSMHAVRQSGETVTLFDGRVLVAGGKGSGNTILASAELYDPVAGTWATTASMSKARNGATATLMYDGHVLVAGGTDVGSPVDPLTSAEIYDPGTGLWTATASMVHRRAFATATLLGSGKVLVAGGVTAADGTLTNTAELYDPTTGKWSPAGTMSATRDHAMAALLFNGRVLVIGGQGSSGKPLASASLYSPSSNTWSSGGTFSGGRTAAATDVLYSGKVLVAGGFGGNGNTVLSSANLYTPAGNGGPGTWKVATAMPAARGHAMDVRLSNGKALVAGGWANNGSSISLKSAVMYAPVPNPTFNVTPGFGPPGISVKVTGGGFTAAEQVKIYFGGTVLATLTANANGGFTATVVTPSNASIGGHVMKAVGQTSARVAQRWFATLAP